MSANKEMRFSTIRSLVDELGGDVGKTRIQKLVYFLQNTCEAPLNYVFRMYYYGPYSEELDDDLAIMEVRGYLRITPDSDGYGYHIRPGEEAVERPDSLLLNSIAKCMARFKKFEISDLELLATLHFVRFIAGIRDKDQVVTKVALLKPKFAKERIRKSYAEMERLLAVP